MKFSFEAEKQVNDEHGEERKGEGWKHSPKAPGSCTSKSDMRDSRSTSADRRPEQILEKKFKRQ